MDSLTYLEDMRVEFYKHNIGIEEKKRVLECLDGIFLTTGEYVSEFESKFAGYMNLKYAVGLNSCTAALHVSLLALGVGPGDEVITTPMTFIATATAVMHTGARPVFVDVEPDTALIDTERIESAITDRTKAIIPVHLYGQLCNMKEVRRIADRHGLKVVEDAAHCIEGERDGVRPGQLGDVACFSFYATKNITSGEGGAIATNSKELADRVKVLRQHGLNREAIDRYGGIYQHLDMIEYGWKYNMNNIQASLLLPQIKKIDKFWERRSDIYKRYMRYLKNNGQIDYPKIAKNSKSAYHLFTIWVDKNIRDDALYKLSTQGIGVAVNYIPVHLQTYFKKTFGYKRGMFTIAEDIGERTISLPFYIKLSDSEIRYVVSRLKEIL